MSPDLGIGGDVVIQGVVVLVVGLALASLLLRRSLLAAAGAVGQAGLALGLLAGRISGASSAAVVVAVAAAIAVTLCGAAVAVHRRRGSDHVDELRELQG